MGAAIESKTPRGQILVGTTSWTEKTLLTRSHFYPPDAKTPEQRLRHYASIFPVVEVDSTFYAIPAEGNAVKWSQRTAPGFVFDVKAYRLFTQHPTPVRSLPADVRGALGIKDTSVYYDKLPSELQGELWRRFRAAIEPLCASGRLGVVLFQFAPWMVFGKDGLQHLAHCAEHMQGLRVAVELRNVSWLGNRNRARTLAALRELELVHVVADEPQEGSFSVPAVWEVTRPDLAVVRLHGRNRETWQQKGLPSASERFAYRYGDDELKAFVTPVKRLAKQAGQVHMLFNNCYSDYAQTNAARFREMLGRRATAQPSQRALCRWVASAGSREESSLWPACGATIARAMGARLPKSGSPPRHAACLSTRDAEQAPGAGRR